MVNFKRDGGTNVLTIEYWTCYVQEQKWLTWVFNQMFKISKL